jgi:hypothetical protein
METLGQLSERRAEIQGKGAGICLVHLSDERAAAEFFSGYGLQDLPRIGDPEGEVYETAGMTRGGPAAFLGPRTVLRGIRLSLGKGLWPGRPAGDVRRMPGALVLDKDGIREAFRPGTVSEPVPWDRLLGAL